jgi:hypothetical protein
LLGKEDLPELCKFLGFKDEIIMKNEETMVPGSIVREKTAALVAELHVLHVISLICSHLFLNDNL